MITLARLTAFGGNLFLFCAGCVPQATYDRVLQENKDLTNQLAQQTVSEEDSQNASSARAQAFSQRNDALAAALEKNKADLDQANAKLTASQNEVADTHKDQAVLEDAVKAAQTAIADEAKIIENLKNKVLTLEIQAKQSEADNAALSDELARLKAKSAATQP